QRTRDYVLSDATVNRLINDAADRYLAIEVMLMKKLGIDTYVSPDEYSAQMTILTNAKRARNDLARSRQTGATDRLIVEPKTIEQLFSDSKYPKEAPYETLVEIRENTVR